MKYFTKKATPIALWFLIFTCFPPEGFAEIEEVVADYYLSVIFNVEENLVTGTAKIDITPGREFSLSFAQLTVTGILLKGQNSSEKNVFIEDDIIVIPSSDIKRELYISYTRKVTNSFTNRINQDGIALVYNWHPVPDAPMRFHVTATLPENFMAVTETDQFPLQKSGNTVTSTFSQLVESIHFTAGPYHHKKLKVRKDLYVHSLFFTEERHLADDYLQAAKKFINRYEKEIGLFPYNHYVIAANRLPSGFGIPGFTLIGQMVLRLPFIKETSLRHEILHSWFGNKVGVDYTTGNWCEGLTSYLADHSNRAERGEGVNARKEIITNYLSYVHEENKISLSDFYSAGHNQRAARAVRAVGYGRGALLFHELKEKIGAESFNNGVRLFYAANKDKKASWKDLQKHFEASSKVKLGVFFAERLQRNDIPSLGIGKTAVSYMNDKPVLSFSLIQQTEAPFSLTVPIQIKSVTGITNHTQLIKEKETQVSIELKNQPLEIILDPEYSFLRKLSPAELPATWSRFMGSDKKLVILAREKDRDIYSTLLQALGDGELPVKVSSEVSNQELSENSLLFLGTDQAPSLSLFADPDHQKDGFTLDVRNNPLNHQYVAVLVSCSNRAEADAISNRLSHYGKYSFLHFLHGRNLEKRISSSRSGISIVLDAMVAGGKTSTISSFTEIVDELSKSRVVYVGETHTSLSDHLLQLRIIEALYARDPNLAIGMEMFPASKQPILDLYITEKSGMDEQTFLQESDYFNVWRYDYRFFRDIIHFAKANKIPIRGLNLDKATVSNIFRSGNTDSLDEDILKSLPPERNLDMADYGERLSLMHNIHMQGGHGKGNISGFIQAQGLWDETMAENIVNYLKVHPKRRMVVLAGAQHSRKDSGIPPRVKRRLDIQQSSVLNINNSSSSMNLKQVADYYFLSDMAELPEPPRIGIVLVTITKDENNYIEISQISPHGKAGEGGLLKGDILKEINGVIIYEMSDIRIAMVNAEEGETVDMKILRSDGSAEIEMQLEVELSSSPPPMIHP